MEHESFVPIPPARLLRALRTPSVVAASLPGWQPDEGDGSEGGAAAPRGRLRLRVGGSTITYRGTVRVTGDGPAFTVVAEGAEVRGAGTVEATAVLAVAETTRPGPGSTLTWQGTARAGGRLAGYEAAVVEAALRRLLDRFAAGLAAHAPDAAPHGPDTTSEATDGGVAGREHAASGPEGAGTGAQSLAEPFAETEPLAHPEPPADPVSDVPDTAAVPEEATASLPEPDAEPAGLDGLDAAERLDATERPDTAERPDSADRVHEMDKPSEFDEVNSVDPAEIAELADLSALADLAQSDADADLDPEADLDADGEESDVVDDLGDPLPASELDEFELVEVEVEVEVPESAAALDDLVPPAEAAHARRTMIGRSAEEVDHAPPRGRYAPVPAPDAGTATATLRWAAPAAAALLASAVVVGRVLRRRK